MMKVLVVTGGIGSGKTEVCRILQEEYRCGVYDADSKVKELYHTHPTLLSDIEAALGIVLRDENGRFTPRRLAEVIFSDTGALNGLENILFPVLMADFDMWKKDYEADRFVVFESATILEKPQLRGFGDRLMIVDAPFDLRLSRACSRNGAAEEEVRARMRNQVLMNRISSGEGYDDADVIIRNIGSIDDLRRQTVDAIGRIFE